MSSKINRFKSELKELLIRYNASIDYCDEGEGYSIYNRRMTVDIDHKEYELCKGEELSVYELRDVE